MDFIVSDESVNHYGFRVWSKGIDLSSFKKNPVMLYHHNDQLLPIGHWENLRLDEQGVIKATPVFDEDDEFAVRIKKKVEKGFIKMASVGLAPPYQFSADSQYLLPGQKKPTLVSCRLREISITPFGGNSNAFRLYDKDGNEMNLSDTTKLFEEKTSKPKSTKTMEDNNLKILLTTSLNLSEGIPNSDLVKHCLNLSQKATSLEAEKNDLQKQLDDLKKEKEVELKENLVNQAVSDKKITDKQKAAYLALSYDQAKNLLDSIEKPQNLSEFPEQGPEAGDDERKEWNLSDWSQKDPEGLGKMKEKNWERYSSLFKAEHGVEPQK